MNKKCAKKDKKKTQVVDNQDISSPEMLSIRSVVAAADTTAPMEKRMRGWFNKLYKGIIVKK